MISYLNLTVVFALNSQKAMQGWTNVLLSAVSQVKELCLQDLLPFLFALLLMHPLCNNEENVKENDKYFLYS